MWLLWKERTQRRRPQGEKLQQQSQEQVNSWLTNKVIEPIKTPALTNNLALVSKKDGRVRVCVDCTPANEVTKDFDWHLPRLQDVRYRTQGKSWFARIDLEDAFFRIGVPARSRQLTAFTVGGQTYKFRRMPLGLKTAPAVFQRFMDHGLSEFADAIWYIDDILITATSGQNSAEGNALHSE
ncbi:Probable transposable element [Penicillium roqueforti FM164]|uniref:RNA-directed DNA polymerase (Reverse transcriptase) n=3 Tax=Penicillium TaxID=5073 RepID=A0A0G4PZ80_PENC3|nr:Probable transposable element [Penicillium roqueforti FM164]CRL31460.1 RNA-directed DNA polymerase (reverse transcriptase) [Penicillium camemberti]